MSNSPVKNRLTYASRKDHPKQSKRNQRCLRIESLQQRSLLAFDLAADVQTEFVSSNPQDFVYFQNSSETRFFVSDTLSKGREIVRMTKNASGSTSYNIIDINPGYDSSNPKGLTLFNGHVYFSAFTEETGTELWKMNTDGVATLLKDIASGDNFSVPRDFTVVGNQLFFSARDDTGYELWVTNGTSAGTVKVKDLSTESFGSRPEELTRFNSKLYFTAETETHGRELWQSDGTAGGTTLVRNINPGGMNSNPKELTVMNGKLYFSAFSDTGRELWVSGGTTATTVLLKDIEVGDVGSEPLGLTAVGKSIYFSANTAATGRELYRYESELINDVFMVKDIRPGVESSSPSDFVATETTVLFAADNGVNGRELWSTGQAILSSTSMLNDIFPGSKSSNPSDMVDANGTIYFSASSSKTGKELYLTTGSSSSTKLVRDIRVGNRSSSPNILAAIDDAVYFAADDGQHGLELWVSRGTLRRTNMLKDQTYANAGSAIDSIDVLGNSMYFGSSGLDGEQDLYRYNASTSALTNLTNDGTVESGNKVVVGDSLYFLKRFDENVQIWKTNGTAATTQHVRTFARPHSKSYVYVDLFADVSGLLYFTKAIEFGSQDDTNNIELWKTDGTTAGTTRAHPSERWSLISGYVVIDDTFYFRGTKLGEQSRLWKSRGTAATTSIVSNSVVDIGNMTKRADKVIFFGVDAATDQPNLYRTDGTSAGTISIIPTEDTVTNMVNVGGYIYTGADHLLLGAELTKTNGTTAGTSVVADINPGAASSYPQSLTKFGDKVAFTASSPAFGREVWISDGTNAGTYMLKDFMTGSSSSNVFGFVVFDGLLYFNADTPDGRRFIVSDGTEAGTQSIVPDSTDYKITSVGTLVPVGSKLFAFANVERKSDGFKLGREIVDYTANSQLLSASSKSNAASASTVSNSKTSTSTAIDSIPKRKRTDSMQATLVDASRPVVAINLPDGSRRSA
jgi:ELWxxDGT repeat protein